MPLRRQNTEVIPLHCVIQGRARLRVKDLYRSEDLAHWLEFKLKSERWIKKASANSYTSNLLIRYDSEHIQLDDILKKIKEWVQHARDPATAAQIRKFRQKSFNSFTTREPNTAWHLLDAKEVIRLQRTSKKNGLTQREAQTRLDRFGFNQVPPPPIRAASEIFKEQLTNLPTLLLIISAGLSVFTGGAGDAILILAVVAANTSIGYATESSAEEIVRSLSQTKSYMTQVIRDGILREIPVECIVVGDILHLTPGTSVPADARLIVANSITADESLITGESLPISKSSKKLKQKALPLADRVNMIFCGTQITGGDGRAVVVHTGSETEIGGIQALIGISRRPQTSLQIQLTELTQKLVFASLGFSSGVLILHLIRRQPILESLKSAITLAIAAIPEGLPTVATTILAQGVKNLKEGGVLVRRIGAIENLGTINLLCLDKTGTLTRNQMTVTTIQAVFNKSNEQTQLMRVAILCNEANEHQGSSTEKALIKMAIDAGVSVKDIRAKYTLVKTRHRSERRGIMSTLHNTPSQGRFLAVKGNPEEVLARCKWYLHNDLSSPITKTIFDKIQAQNKEMSENGLRVLGFAFKESSTQKLIKEDQLTWLGLVGMSDPIRFEVHRFLKDLKRAGVRPVIVTGDQATTALSVGKKLGLGNRKAISVIESTRLESASPHEFSQIAGHADIFARVSPAHKLRIVQALQRSGNIVAMTGDGINDGPALKTANVGIAMGVNGTDVARKVADIVLVKDNLYSIILAVQEGRKIRENLKKSIDYIIVQNLTEVLLTFISTLSGLGSPLSPMQLLWINLITDILPELALAQEQPEDNLLQRKPEPAWMRLVPKKDAQRIGFDSTLLTATSLGTYLYGIRRYGMGPEAKTLAFLSINTASLLYTVAARSKRVTIFDRQGLEKNKYIPAALGAGFSAELLITAIPYFRGWLGAGKLSPLDIFVVTAGSTFPLFLIEIKKFISVRLGTDLQR